jgi:hypothetical protein
MNTGRNEASTQYKRDVSVTSIYSFRFGCNVSRKGGKCVLTRKETLLKNNLHFVNDAPIIYVNFITIVIKGSERKWEALLPHSPSYFQGRYKNQKIITMKFTA